MRKSYFFKNLKMKLCSLLLVFTLSFSFCVPSYAVVDPVSVTFEGTALAVLVSACAAMGITFATRSQAEKFLSNYVYHSTKPDLQFGDDIKNTAIVSAMHCLGLAYKYKTYNDGSSALQIYSDEEEQQDYHLKVLPGGAPDPDDFNKPDDYGDGKSHSFAGRLIAGGLAGIQAFVASLANFCNDTYEENKSDVSGQVYKVFDSPILRSYTTEEAASLVSGNSITIYYKDGSSVITNYYPLKGGFNSILTYYDNNDGVPTSIAGTLRIKFDTSNNSFSCSHINYDSTKNLLDVDYVRFLDDYYDFSGNLQLSAKTIESLMGCVFNDPDVYKNPEYDLGHLSTSYPEIDFDSVPEVAPALNPDFDYEADHGADNVPWISPVPENAPVLPLPKIEGDTLVYPDEKIIPASSPQIDVEYAPAVNPDQNTKPDVDQDLAPDAASHPLENPETLTEWLKYWFVPDPSSIKSMIRTTLTTALPLFMWPDFDELEIPDIKLTDDLYGLRAGTVIISNRYIRDNIDVIRLMLDGFISLMYCAFVVLEIRKLFDS